jgi:hypothetical protein
VVFRADVTDLPSGHKVYIEDREARTFTRIDEEGSSYSVVLAAASKGTGRFYLHTKSAMPGTPDNPADKVKIITMPQEGLIRIVGKCTLPARARLYDLEGRLISSSALTNPEQNEMIVPMLKNGIYLLQLVTGEFSVNRKISWIN